MKFKLPLVSSFILVVLLSAALAPAIQPQNIAFDYELISVTYSFTDPILTSVENNDATYDVVTITGLENTYDLGRPCIPFKTAKILVPAGKTVDAVEVSASSPISLGENFNVQYGDGLVHISEKDSYASSPVYFEAKPYDIYSVVGEYCLKGYTIVFINLHPVHYISDSGELLYYEQLAVKIKTKDTNANSFVRGLNQDKQRIQTLVDNPSYIESYTSYGGLENAAVDYLLITSETFKNMSGNTTFENLLTLKEAQGMTTAMVSVEEIMGNPNCWVNGTWGDNNPGNPFYTSSINTNFSRFNDTSAMIRNYIRMSYVEFGTSYVLLGGDADGWSEEENIVPLRGLYANESGLPLGNLAFEEDAIPSDMYYACLDGNFNYDLDEFFGEAASRNDQADVDEADLLSEVSVGRACVDSIEEVQNFVMKTVSYETTEDEMYHRKVLMVGEYLGFPGVSAYGANYKDLIIPLIPEPFEVHTLYDRDRPSEWDKQELIDMLNTAPPHLINHLGHGFVNYGLRLHNPDIAALTNEKYFFIYSQTCLAGSFDNCYRDTYYEDDCAAEYFTVETTHGAVAVIMNARFGLGSEDTLDSPSQAYDASFYDMLMNTDMAPKIGPVNHYSKEAMLGRILENGHRWVYYQTNLLGDPDLTVKHPSGPNVELQVTFSYPEEGGIYLLGSQLLKIGVLPKAVVIGGIQLAAEAQSEPDGYVFSVEFFVDNDSYYIDFEPPYTADLEGVFLFGNHELKATVHGAYGKDQTDSIEAFLLVF